MMNLNKLVQDFHLFRIYLLLFYKAVDNVFSLFFFDIFINSHL